MKKRDHSIKYIVYLLHSLTPHHIINSYCKAFVKAVMFTHLKKHVLFNTGKLTTAPFA